MAVYFYGCVTMDGYLADSQHRIDWLHQLGSVEDSNVGAKRLYEKIGFVKQTQVVYLNDKGARDSEV